MARKKKTVRNLLRFEWAMKYVLIDKRHINVVEGLLASVFNEKIKILRVFNLEGDQDLVDIEFNRVDLLVKNTKNELLIVELNNNGVSDYMYGMLYGITNTVANFMEKRARKLNIQKIYFIYIVYFELGKGLDSVYRGESNFRGIHCGDTLQLNDKQRSIFLYDDFLQIYPEYFILRVGDFDGVVKDTLDEWVYFFKNKEIPGKFSAKGLVEARDILQYNNLTDEEQKSYNYYLDRDRFEINVMETSRILAFDEGLKIGIKKGRKKRMIKGKIEGKQEGKTEEKERTVKKLYAINWEPDAIAKFTALTMEQVLNIIEEIKKSDEENSIPDNFSAKNSPKRCTTISPEETKESTIIMSIETDSNKT